jgi:hypothetical protein
MRTCTRDQVYRENSITIAVIDQSAIRGLKRSLLAGLDGGVAYKCLDLHDGGDLQSARIVYRFALSSDWLWSARIVYRWMLTVVLAVGSTVGLTVDSTVSSTVGSMVGLMVGLTVGSTWLCWAINLSKVFDSSDERLNKLVVLQTCFTGFVKWTRRFKGS